MYEVRLRVTGPEIQRRIHVMRGLVYPSSLVVLMALTISCSSPQKTPTTVAPNDVAYFAGGCFWGVEHFLEQMPGVASVESGYSGGILESPSYQDVIVKNTGHLEAVRVRFDSNIVSFEQVAKRFFEIHDPTQADGQGPDLGAQYLSAVFYTSDEQKEVTKKLMLRLMKRGYDVVTELRPFEKFWPAEEYHQDYYVKNGKKPYCHRPVNRFGD